MAEIAIKTIQNTDAGTLKISDDIFGDKERGALLHETVVNHLANQRQGTHATKTKGLVSGGGKKPWRQKGTGRARAGSSRSPLWRGGGTTFGPLPRDYSVRMPKMQKRKALLAACAAQLQCGAITVVEAFTFTAPKTSEMAKTLKAFGIASNESVLVVTRELDKNVALSARNIPNLDMRRAFDLNAYDVLSHSKVLITKEALEALEQRETAK